MFEFIILGCGAGAVYALLGQGIVLIFRGSGILNLAHGAIAMLVAYVTTSLRIEQGWGGLEAILLGIVLAAAIGILVDVALMRRLGTASPLTRVIGTLAVFLVIYSFGVIQWTNIPGVAQPLFPSGPVDVLGATVPQDRIWTLGLAVLLTIGLSLIWRHTRIGWITEAVAENQTSAAALGISPKLVSTGTWAVGAGLAGFAGALMAPLAQLSVAGLSMLVIPALAAALIGAFRSFSLTLAGGLLIGVAQSLAGAYTGIVGAPDALPLLIIVAILAIRGTNLPLRGHTFDRLPRVGTGVIHTKPIIAVALVGLVVLSLLSSQLWLSTIATTLSIAVLLLSLVVLVGYAGQLSLAQYALAGMGALFSAQLVANAGFPFEVAVVAGILGTMIVGLLFALPALRTRGANLAVVTLGLGLAVETVVFRNSDYTGGVSGIPVGGQTLFGINIDAFDHPSRYAILAFLAFIGAALLVANIRRGRSGRRLLAVRGNERAAASLGVNVYAAKLFAFSVAGGLAGLGGILMAFQANSVTFAGFIPLNSIQAIAQAVIGGVGYVLGPAVGAQLAHGSWGSIIALEWSEIDKYLPMIGGGVLILNLLIAPDGVADDIRETKDALLAKLRRRDGDERPAASEEAGEPGGASESVGRVPPADLKVSGVTVRFGNVVAVKEVDLAVAPGQVVGLIGPNGAGKTSLMDAITGLVPSTGEVEISGRSIVGAQPYERARLGMVRSFQGLELFDDITVRENILVASDRQEASAYLSDLVKPGGRELPPVAQAAVERFKLADDLDRRPVELSLGKQRLVAIARAVAAEPSILLLDEPAAGLDQFESAELSGLVRRLADELGMAILVVEHDMTFVMDICDHVVVLEFGAVISTGTPEEVSNDPRAVEAYLGSLEQAASTSKPEADNEG